VSTQKVNVTAGAVEYTWPWTGTETSGQDISNSTVELSLGTYSEPGEWLPPDVITRPQVYSVTAQILIDDSYLPGTYWLWRTIHDAPEVLPKKTPLRVIIT
jgi:hypothetical protein